LTNVGFHPDRIKDNENNISSMLSELSDDFMKNKGGGMSFLKMCDDKNDNQWTHLHKTMEQLVLLGLSIDKVSYLMPREMWAAFPGGMPYIVIK